MTEIIFEEIPEDEAAEILASGGRGRKGGFVLEYLKAFIGSGKAQARLARASIPASVKSVSIFAGQTNAFARKHKLPVIVKSRGGDVYFFRKEETSE